ncbi:MAG: VPLPA-CTERM sorting domain-containing protein [Bdellovibrionales bacterium]|jgi:opacity protein-like surface antigen
MKKLLLAVLAVLALTAPAQAATVGIASVGALGTTDTYDWGQLGDAFQELSSPQNVTSNGGATAVVSSDGALARFDQGIEWSGNFPNGEKLLYSSPYGFAFSLTNPVQGIGMQIQPNYFGSFVAEITAYDSNDTVLGTFMEPGSSTYNEIGDGIFLGVLSDLINISKIGLVVYDPAAFQEDGSIEPGYLLDFAVGTVYTTVPAVPLPAALPLFAGGLLGLGLFKRRKA